MTTTEPKTTTLEPSAGKLLRERQFRHYWSAQTISLVGDQVSLLALPLLAALLLHAGPAQMGYLTAAGLVPNLVLSMYAGVWVDRRPYRRHVMIAADIGRFLLVATIPVLYALGDLQLWHLYAVALGVGTLSIFFEVANTTLFVSLVPREGYVQASSLLNGSRAMSFVVGPTAAGWLVQFLTAPVALLVDAVSYLCSGVLLSRIRPTEPPPETERKGQLLAGLKYLFGNATLRSMLLAVATVNFFNYMFWALVIFYATVDLGISPGVLGVVLGAASFGALLGSVITGRLTRGIGLGRAYVLGIVVFTAPLLLVPLAGGPMPLVLGMLFCAEFTSGLGVMVLDITAGVIGAAVIPNEMRARVAGASRTVNYGIRPLGALAGGALGALAGVRPTLWVAAAGALLGLLFLVRSPVLSMRDLPDAAPASG
jgi:MFS family permease